LDLAGERVRDLLAKGLNIDLHPLAFAVDAAVVTTMAQIPITLWQIDPAPIYRITVPRSWIGSFLHWLGVSAAEFGLQILPAEDRVARGLRSEAGGAANSGRSLG
jgi:sarcosine oxidase subunit gamma